MKLIHSATTYLIEVELLNVLAEEVDGDGVLPVAAVPPRQLGSGAVVAEVLLRRVVEGVVLRVPPEIGDDDDEDDEDDEGRGERVEGKGIRAFPLREQQ